MAPNSTAVSGLLRQTIYYHLDNGSWDNALFFSERLMAHDPRSNESAHLLALSHLRTGDKRSAYEVSKPLGYRGLHLGCAFVFAQSCLALERFVDGAVALEKAKGLWLHKASLGKHSATTRAGHPDAATINCLLGKLHRGMDDRKKAAGYFEDALRANPLMWDAFTALCDIGLSVRVSNTFRVSETLLRCFEPETVSGGAGLDSTSAGYGYLAEQQLPHIQNKRPAASARPPGPHEMSDPFDHQPPQPPPHTTQQRPVHAATHATGGLGEPEENDFMARIFAARSRMAAGSGSGYQSPPVDGVATPPGMQQEPPQAPARRRAGVPPASTTADTGFHDGQPTTQQLQSQPPQNLPPAGVSSKIMYRLSATTSRRGRAAEAHANGDLSAPDHASSLLRSTTASATNGGSAGMGPAAPATGAPPTASLPMASSTTAERKRTASGHPVVPRQAAMGQPDEAGVPQRRSARLNMFKASAGRTNAGAATVGGTAGVTRELKKARPPISRIVRPGSSGTGSTVGRVVSGNRKPVDDGGMDVDPMEGPRVRDPAAAASAAAVAAAATATANSTTAHQSLLQQQLQAQAQAQSQVPAHSQAQSSQPPHQLGPSVLHQAQLQRQGVSEADFAKTEEALRWILELLKKLGGGYLALSQFRCPEALQIFNTLPRAHMETPWVQAMMGRAQYELAAYAEAEVCFRRVRVLAPTRLEDMEVYSTILWFLKRETDLSFLAHELVDADWHSPQAWCALGNAWSLAQDHEQALRCFRRATQLNPKFAYAYTLQGHEHVLNEEYDKALTAYRHAVAADRRHYNAYYGIGRVYEKLGNFDKAYAHYHTASVIHPTNAVLICCIGKVLERQKQIGAALQYFSKATDLAPRAAQTRFRKARALLATGQLQAAQQELMILKDLAPDEAAVHFLLGKLYKTLNDKSAAVRHFTIALSLDPKASQKIKQAIGSLEDDEDGLEDYMVA